jgi:uncharacterized protein (DUF1778 family)
LKKNKQLLIRLTEDEYNLIKKSADKVSMSISDYCRDMALFDNASNRLIEHTKERIKIEVEYFKKHIKKNLHLITDNSRLSKKFSDFKRKHINYYDNFFNIIRNMDRIRKNTQAMIAHIETESLNNEFDDEDKMLYLAWINSINLHFRGIKPNNVNQFLEFFKSEIFDDIVVNKTDYK